MSSHDPFASRRCASARRRRPAGKGPASLLRELLAEAAPGLLADDVLLAEAGASSCCVGWYVSTMLGPETEAWRYGAAPPVPALRLMRDNPDVTRSVPLVGVAAARALQRLAPDDSETTELANLVVDQHQLGDEVRRPRWFASGEATPTEAWFVRDARGMAISAVTAWIDSLGSEQSLQFFFDVDEPRALDAVCVGGSVREHLDIMRPIDDQDEVQSIEACSITEAAAVLEAALERTYEVAAAGRTPWVPLAMMERRIDLLSQHAMA